MAVQVLFEKLGEPLSLCAPFVVQIDVGSALNTTTFTSARHASDGLHIAVPREQSSSRE